VLVAVTALPIYARATLHILPCPPLSDLFHVSHMSHSSPFGGTALVGQVSNDARHLWHCLVSLGPAQQFVEVCSAREDDCLAARQMLFRLTNLLYVFILFLFNGKGLPTSTRRIRMPAWEVRAALGHLRAACL